MAIPLEVLSLSLNPSLSLSQGLSLSLTLSLIVSLSLSLSLSLRISLRPLKARFCDVRTMETNCGNWVANLALI